MINYTINDVLNGEPNTDHEGTVRWRFTGLNDEVVYFSLKELDDYFQGYIDDMAGCIIYMKMVGKE